MNKGFTLIELLVVVLIIGILAAIALPQYTKAVERSRMAEAVQVLGDVATAQSIFYMQHNSFATDLSDLNNRGDVQISFQDDSNKWSLSVAGATQTMTRNGGMYSGAQLQLIVAEDGGITKNCIANGKADFCTLGANMGYTGTGTSASAS